MLKIYGDAPLTVSDSTVTLGLDVDGVGSRFTGITDNVYVNLVSVTTLVTVVLTL